MIGVSAQTSHVAQTWSLVTLAWQVLRYSLPDIIKMKKSRTVRWAGDVAHMGTKRSAHRILGGIPEAKSPLARPGCRWEVNIKICIKTKSYCNMYIRC
jgi:hypothetical protein